MKKVVVPERHQYHRYASGTSVTLNYEGIKNNGDSFYNDNYFVNDFTIVLVSNIGPASDPASFSSKRDILMSKLRGVLASVVPRIRKYNPKDQLLFPSFPFSGLPRLIAVKAREYDSLLLKYQVSSDYSQEMQYENLLFIKTALRKLIRTKLVEMKMMSYIDISIMYHSTFCIFNIEYHLSYQGKTAVNKLISLTISAISHLYNEKHTESLYKKYKDELEAAYNTKGIYTSRDILDTVCSKGVRFGYKHAFRSSVTLNEYNEAKLKSLLGEMMDSKSLFVVLSGDFKERNVNQASQTQSFDLESALSVKITNTYNYEKKEKEAGSIVLDKIENLYNVFYKDHQITKSEVEYLYDKARTVHFGGYGSNPYLVDSHTVTKQIENHDHLVRSKLIHDSFDPEKNRVGPNKCIYYRTNRLFPYPMVYANLKFGVSNETANSGRIAHVNYALKMMMIRHIWTHRLRLVQDYLSEVNGKVEVFYAHGLLNLHVYASRDKFEKVLSDVLLSLDINSIIPMEFEDASEKVMNALTSDERSFEKVNQQIVNFVLRNEFLDIELLRHMQAKRYEVSGVEIKLNLVFGYFEGDLDKRTAENLENTISYRYTM